MSDATIKIERISKSFGTQQVLNEVSLNIPAGQTFALLGRNGAGKTTTIRILLGLIPADSGTIEMAGLDPTKDPLTLRSQVGYLGEDQTMYGWMTSIELCRFLAPFYPTWDEEWVQAFLQRFDIPLHTRIGQLSKGQTVKLGLGVALAHRPPIVILDDPAMGLDPVSRKEFNRDLVEHLQTSGTTVLYSSHLLDEVEAVADAVAILDRGKIVRSGETDQLRREVMQLLIPLESAHKIEKPSGLLDVRRHENRLAIVTDHAGEVLEQFAAQGVHPEVIDLSLDEIFEAFVVGRTHEWPDPSANPTAVPV